MSQITTVPKQHLFDFWDTLPVVHQLPAQHFADLLKPTRRTILEILLQGVVDIYPDTDDSRIRYAMSANEIRKKLEEGNDERKEIEISYQNTYFHLQKLEDLGAIQVVGYLVNGKRTTAYYGRTAKTFISSSEDELGYASFIRDETFDGLLHKLDQNISGDKLSEIRKNIEVINRSNYASFQNWLDQHKGILHGLPIDYRKLMELYYLVKNVDQDFLDGLKKLGEIMGIR